MAIEVGETVRFTEMYETEFFMVLGDSTGTVVKTEGYLSIEMDEIIVGCEEWDNCVNFFEDDDLPFEVARWSMRPSGQADDHEAIDLGDGRSLSTSAGWDGPHRLWLIEGDDHGTINAERFKRLAAKAGVPRELSHDYIGRMGFRFGW